MMYSLTIPFSNETIDNIKLVEGEREEVEQQLDQRRIAMQEIRAIGRSAENSEIIIDAENDKVIVDNAGPIAVEVNDTLKVLIKSVLRNVKDIGYANENIIAMAISSTNKHCLLTEYANFYKTDSFGTIITSLITLGNTAFQNVNTLIHNVISKQKLEELSSGNYSKDKDSYDVSQYLIDTPILEYLKNINRIKDILTNMNISLSRFGNSDVKENGSEEVIPTDSFKDWENMTITSLENKEVESVIRLVLELNKKFTTSIAMVYDAIASETSSYGDEEISAAMDEIRIQYNLLCANSEFNLVSERTQALENYTNNLMAIEAFRDSNIGRILNYSYRMIKAIVKGVIEYYASLIKSFINTAIEIITKVNAKLISFKIKEKTQKLKEAGVSVYFNGNLSNPKFYTKYNGQIKCYDVSIKGVASGITSNDETSLPSMVKLVEIDSLKDITDDFTDDGENVKYIVKGYIISIDKVNYVIATQAGIFVNLRNIVVDFLKDGNDDKLYICLNSFRIMLNNIINTLYVTKNDNNLELDFPNVVFREKSSDYREVLTQCQQLKSALNKLNEHSTEVDNFNSVFLKQQYNKTNLQVLSKSVGVSAKEIDKEIKGIDKIFEKVGDDEESVKRANVAKEYTKVVCEASKLVTVAINNTIQIACRAQRFECYSNLINAKLINRIYKDIIND